MKAIYTYVVPKGTTGGTYTLTADSHTTSAINHDAKAADIHKAISALDSGAYKDTEVRGPDHNGEVEVIFYSKDVKEFSADGSSLTGGTKKIDATQTYPAVEKAQSNFKDGTYEQLAAEKRGSNIRKALGATILIADMRAAVPPRILNGEGGLTELRRLGYKVLGHHKKSEGINFGRETEKSEVESHGETESTRTDIIKNARTVSFDLQETNRMTLAMMHNKEFQEVQLDDDGVIRIDGNSEPVSRDYRVITVAKDGAGDDAIYFVEAFPRATLSEVKEQQWSSESEVSYGFSFDIKKDPDLSIPYRYELGGPGLAKLKEYMGFPVEQG